MTLFSPNVEPRPLRAHQVRALEMLRASLRAGHKRPMIQAPTGFGKTLLTAHIIRGALAKGNSVIFTVPALSLIEQTVAAFEAEGIGCIGVMQGDHVRTDQSQPVQVCSVQTLARREKPRAALVIIDEAHRMFADVNSWMEDSSWADVPFVGLSATPWAKGLGRYYDDLIVAARTGELIDHGYLSPFVVYAPSSPDLSGVRMVAGEFHQGELADACNTSTLVGDVVAEWLTRGEGRPTLSYGVDRAHALHKQARFIEAGIAAEYIDAFTPNAERERIFDRFRTGETKIICNVGTLTTGIDLDVRCIIDAKPTKSEMLFVQTIGRGLRTALGKDYLLVLDHAGNHLRLGCVTDIHHERLDDGSRRKPGDCREEEKPAPRPLLCEECKAIISRGSPACPYCGHVREPVSCIEERNGNLVRLGSGESGKRAPTIAEMAAFHGELKYIADARGYSPGWAAHKFRERFGHWPNGARVRHAKPRAPSVATTNWVRSRWIAFAKGEARHG
ncbi:hypothetical protein AMST5_04083 [freshwater sediment metagenome]|uniref:Helicase ATP-binding domain-containing protein n=1 Tax=freshwater sediment metagenome TaxID=556182 RepID=A0AA48RC19_9ZZZZ